MNMATQDGKLWMNGTMIEQPDAKVHVLTHSLHYGMAVFEGVRAYQTADNRTAIFRLKEQKLSLNFVIRNLTRIIEYVRAKRKVQTTSI